MPIHNYTEPARGSDKTSEINKKLKSVREDMLKCDWTTDKMYQLPGRNGKFTDVHYVTLPKIKRNANMVFLEHGIDFKIDMVSIESSEGRCRLQADVILTDLDSDEQDITRIIATAPVSDKDSSVALAFVQREYFSSRFGIIDGLNFDEDERENTLVNALYAKSVAPMKSPSDSVPVAVEPKENVLHTLDIPVPEKTAKSKPKSDAPTNDKPLSPMEEKGCVKAMTFIESVKDSIDPALYEKAKNVFDNRSTTADVLVLMEIKRDIQSKQAPKQEGM